MWEFVSASGHMSRIQMKALWEHRVWCIFVCTRYRTGGKLEPTND